jgi:hypothetical protein
VTNRRGHRAGRSGSGRAVMPARRISTYRASSGRRRRRDRRRRRTWAPLADEDAALGRGAVEGGCRRRRGSTTSATPAIVMTAVRGDEPLLIPLRAGHTNLTTTQRYLARAKNRPANFGEVFAAPPVGTLPGLLSSGDLEEPGTFEVGVASPTAFDLLCTESSELDGGQNPVAQGGRPGRPRWRPQRDSNTGERARSRAMWRDFARAEPVVSTR